MASVAEVPVSGSSSPGGGFPDPPKPNEKTYVKPERTDTLARKAIGSSMMGLSVTQCLTGVDKGSVAKAFVWGFKKFGLFLKGKVAAAVAAAAASPAVIAVVSTVVVVGIFVVGAMMVR